jgi:hypothetical protein
VTLSLIGTTSIAFTVDFAYAFAFVGAFHAFDIVGVAFFALKATDFCYPLNDFLTSFANLFATAFKSLFTFIFPFSFASFDFLIAFVAY